MKILVLLSRVPYPLEKGDKLRAFNQIKELSKKHEIILFALNDSPLHKDAVSVLSQYCKNIEIVNLNKLELTYNLVRSLVDQKPFQVGYFYNNRAQKVVDKLIKQHKPDHIYCQLIRTAEYVKHHTIPKTLDYMDVFSKGMERRKTTEPFYLKPILSIEHKRLLKFEKEAFAHFQNKTIISSQDRNFIPHPENSDIKVIPNGVDMDFFKPAATKKEYDILFNGNMSYPPNVESVEFLVKKILPLVKKEIPHIKVLISGANPSARVLALQSESVTISGWVEDIRTSFRSSKLLVAPMQISIGLQNKLLEAMAMKIPCVTSTLANNALGAVHENEIIVADKPEEYAQAITRLLNDPEYAEKIGFNGYSFALANYNWKTTTESLEQLMFS